MNEENMIQYQGFETTHSTQEAGGDNWYSALPEELREEPSLRRFKDISGLAKSYIHANKLVGDKLGMPSENANEEDWQAFYSRLGRPENPDAYQVGIEGDQGFIKAAKDWFHEAGLTQKQAEKLSKQYADYMEGYTAKAEAEVGASGEAEIEALRQEWGQNYDTNVALGQRAVRHFASEEVPLEQLEQAMGSAALLKMFHRIGAAMSEDTLVDTQGGRHLFAITTEEAKSQIQRMMGNKDTVEALMNRNHPQHHEAMQKRSELFKVAYGGEQ